MSLLLSQLKETADWITAQFAPYEEYDEGHDYPWQNRLWRDRTFRRAHLDIVDARDTRKLYMMHLTVFPHRNDPAPVFGFDIIAGPSKVTGLFHDFSPIGGDTPLDAWFRAAVRDVAWSKQRDLPPWAKAIFNPHMVAAGNVHDPAELDGLLKLVRANLSHYLNRVGSGDTSDYTAQQNRYCANQKQNPHTPRVMEALGFEPKVVHEFIHTCLFPEIQECDA